MAEGSSMHIGQSSPSESMDGLLSDVRIYVSAYAPI